jgi:hypothetical protein
MKIGFGWYIDPARLSVSRLEGSPLPREISGRVPLRVFSPGRAYSGPYKARSRISSASFRAQYSFRALLAISEIDRLEILRSTISKSPFQFV